MIGVGFLRKQKFIFVLSDEAVHGRDVKSVAVNQVSGDAGRRLRGLPCD